MVVSLLSTGLVLTVTTAPPTDRNGDPTGTGATTTIPGCLVFPRGSTENTDLRDTVYTGLVVYAPPGTSIAATSTVTIPRHPGTWQVDGDPGRWDATGAPWEPGVEIALRQVR